MPSPPLQTIINGRLACLVREEKDIQHGVKLFHHGALQKTPLYWNYVIREPLSVDPTTLNTKQNESTYGL